jgi:hypothetical protein
MLLEQTGLDSVDNFINSWNSRDPDLWASSLNYPHVRPSPFGEVLVAKDATEYASRVDFKKVLATGWDHSEWDYKHVIHTSPEKIHVAGQWSRYDKNGDIIHTNPVVYIVTHVEGHWGIQSRFGSDYAGDDHDGSGFENRAFNLITDFVSQFNNNRHEACAELLNYPHYVIGVGKLSEHLTPESFSMAAGKITINSLQAIQTGIKSLNIALDLTVNGNAYQAVMNISERDSHLGIQAWSLLNPDAQMSD